MKRQKLFFLIVLYYKFKNAVGWGRTRTVFQWLWIGGGGETHENGKRKDAWLTLDQHAMIASLAPSETPERRPYKRSQALLTPQRSAQDDIGQPQGVFFLSLQDGQILSSGQGSPTSPTRVKRETFLKKYNSLLCWLRQIEGKLCNRVNRQWEVHPLHTCFTCRLESSDIPRSLRNMQVYKWLSVGLLGFVLKVSVSIAISEGSAISSSPILKVSTLIQVNFIKKWRSINITQSKFIVLCADFQQISLRQEKFRQRAAAVHAWSLQPSCGQQRADQVPSSPWVFPREGGSCSRWFQFS